LELGLRNLKRVIEGEILARAKTEEIDEESWFSEGRTRGREA